MGLQEFGPGWGRLRGARGRCRAVQATQLAIIPCGWISHRRRSRSQPAFGTSQAPTDDQDVTEAFAVQGADPAFRDGIRSRRTERICGCRRRRHRPRLCAERGPDPPNPTPPAVCVRAQRWPFPDGRGPAQALRDGAVDVRSAGSEPADTINPAVQQVMAEIGIDLSTEQPKKLTTTPSEPPMWSSLWAAGTPARSTPANATSTGNSPTPPARGPEQISSIRDEIATRVRALIAELGVATTAIEPGSAS